MVVETNRYANDQGPIEKWTLVTVTDSKAFVSKNVKTNEKVDNI